MSKQSHTEQKINEDRIRISIIDNRLQNLKNKIGARKELKIKLENIETKVNSNIVGLIREYEECLQNYNDALKRIENLYHKLNYGNHSPEVVQSVVNSLGLNN